VEICISFLLTAPTNTCTIDTNSTLKMSDLNTYDAEQIKLMNEQVSARAHYIASSRMHQHHTHYNAHSRRRHSAARRR
jgi:hypothetical protein